jgi:hypothetical protein
MRYLLIARTDEIAEAGTHRDDEKVVHGNRLIHEMIGAKVLIAADGLLPSAYGAVVTIANGKPKISESPARERNPVGAFALIDVASKDDATEWAGRFALAHSAASIEVRQIAELSDFGPLARELSRDQAR